MTPGNNRTRVVAPRPARRGIASEHFVWGDLVTGDRASLEAHADCPQGLFDGEGDTWTASRRVALPNGRVVRVTRRGKSRFQMRVELNAAERESRRRQYILASEVKAAAGLAKRKIEQIPTSTEEYRRRAIDCAELFERGLDMVAAGAPPDIHGGYMLDAEAQNEVGVHLQALRSIFATGRVVLDRDARRRGQASIMEPLRAANPAIAHLIGDQDPSDGSSR